MTTLDHPATSPAVQPQRADQPESTPEPADHAGAAQPEYPTPVMGEPDDGRYSSLMGEPDRGRYSAVMGRPDRESRR